MWKLPNDPDGKIFVWTLVAMFALALGSIAIAGLWEVWPELRKDVLESPTEAIRNIALTLTAPVALAALYLTWRRNQQTMRQVETQLRQAGSAESGQYYDRFQNALKMLENKHENIQIAGIALLDRIRHEVPGEFDGIVMQLFCDMASDKLQPGPTTETRDLFEVPYSSNFDPKVNARLVQALVNDQLGHTRKSGVALAVSLTRLTKLQAIDLVQHRDVHRWRIAFRGCHFEEVELFSHETRIFEFEDCQIDKLTVSFRTGEAGRFAYVQNCVIGVLEVEGPSGKEFTEANFMAQCRATNCHFDNGRRMDLKQLFDKAGPDSAFLFHDGLRPQRDPY